MTRFGQLESTFNMDPTPEDNDSVQEKAKQLAESYREKDHFETHEQEMDEISELALDYSKTLHDLGMSGEAKHAGEIFNASANMMKIALDARQQKLEKKFKMMKLELERMKMERSAPEASTQQLDTENVRILDRNELLAQLKELNASGELNNK